MKVQLTFELDLSSSPAFNVANLSELRSGLQNLTDWLAELHNCYLEKKCDTLANPKDDPVIQEAILAYNDENIGLSDQIFNDFRIVGKTDDGHTFDINKDRTLIDGKVTHV